MLTEEQIQRKLEEFGEYDPKLDLASYVMPNIDLLVDHGTGEITVVSTDRRVPGRGARVEVRGRVEDVAVLGGRPLGLHLREQHVRYR